MSRSAPCPASRCDPPLPSGSSWRSGARKKEGDVGKLLSFMVVTLDGYTEGPNQEFDWPTPAAIEGDPLVAGHMNRVAKVVFSTTLTSADWENTTLVTGDAAAAVSALKEQPGKNLAIFGSSTLTVSLLEQDLVDELRVMVMPILLGAGRSLFSGLPKRVHLKLVRSTTFSSGNVMLHYRPAAS